MWRLTIFVRRHRILSKSFFADSKIIEHGRIKVPLPGLKLDRDPFKRKLRLDFYVPLQS